MHTIQKILIFIFVIILAACEKPLPPDKMAYAGEWEAKDMYLLINPDGNVKYKRVLKRSSERMTSKSSVTLNLPLKEFKGNDFEVGFSGMTTTFVVSKPPYQDGSVWKMVVDGVELIKTES